MSKLIFQFFHSLFQMEVSLKDLASRISALVTTENDAIINLKHEKTWPI